MLLFFYFLALYFAYNAWNGAIYKANTFCECWLLILKLILERPSIQLLFSYSLFYGWHEAARYILYHDINSANTATKTINEDQINADIDTKL